MAVMGKSAIVQILAELNTKDVMYDSEETDLRTLQVLDKCHLDVVQLQNKLSEKTCFDIPLQNAEGRYLSLNIYLLNLLSSHLSKGDLLSVQESKTVKFAFSNVVMFGILINLVPNVPFCKSDNRQNNTVEVIKARYTRLVFTLNAINGYIKTECYRNLIVPAYLKEVLVGLYQIVYCPIKKPSEQPDETGFHMTVKYYEELMKEKAYFKDQFEYLASSIYKPVYVRETMLLLKNTAPLWFKKAVTTKLQNILVSEKGVEHIAAAMFDGTTDDSTKTWNSLDAITNLIFGCKKSPNFKDVCEQVVHLLAYKNRTLYEHIFVWVTKKFYGTDPNLSEEIFLSAFFRSLTSFTRKQCFKDNEDVTDHIKQTVRSLHSLFAERHGNRGVLPATLLKPYVTVLFRLHTVVHTIKAISYDTADVLLKYVKTCSNEDISTLFDQWLFGIGEGLDIKDLQLMVDGERITAKHTEHTVVYSPEENAEVLTQMLKKNTELLSKLFAYLLNCLVEDWKYFTNDRESRELLQQEDEFVADASLQRKLVVFKHLATLAEDRDIQEYISSDPSEIVKYVGAVFNRTVKTRLWESDCSSEGFQSVFTLCMVLQILVESVANSKCFESLIPLLVTMKERCKDNELRNSMSTILEILCNGRRRETRKVEVTELDEALEEICDPLLPVRGHGLMTLTQLVKNKDKSAMDRIHFIENIFKQNLKTDDSFIYLRAIEGLASVCLVLPESGLRVLSEEYADFSRKDTEDGVEVRMKIGEVLVRITRQLGEMCPLYKDLLLNTFLSGTKDEDHLVRASSLSNLAEVCEVLGYKLGSIVTEILICVHLIISTDKAPEPRRAAVTVIRQLLKGLGNEMLFFLRDAILPLYRELKLVYQSDKDDVMRLQAQLALEELNDNMKEFVFPTPRINVEVKPVVMK